MASFDVNDAFDPAFITLVTVIRRTETVNNLGRGVITELLIPNVEVVITMSSPSDLRRLSDYDIQSKAYTVVTPFRLQGIAPNQKNDIILYDGDRYQIMDVKDYTNYGRGFVSAIAVSEVAAPNLIT